MKGVENMKLDVVLNSRKGTHSATGTYEKDKFTVHKGSKINLDIAQYLKEFEIAKSMRNDKTVVNENGIVLKDCTFTSPSAAAQFVTGRSVNGYICWRPDDKMSLREYLKSTK